MNKSFAPVFRTSRSAVAVLLLILSSALWGASAAQAGSIGADADLDPRFRAKLVKEKLRLGALEQQAARLGRGAGAAGAEANCGSQSIGVVDTGGKIGAAPREVFVYAPNAINFVNARGCK